ncbi:MAG TPA: hypothetical protein VF060_10940 [Trebonia sp.]
MTPTNFIGSVVTVAPTSASARASTNWIGVLDDHEMDALDDALRLYHGLI